VEFKAYQAFADRLQKDAAIEVYEVGGYWPVQVALSSVGDELGKATSFVLAEDLAKAAPHLMNAVWVLGCIGNQYCCDLSKAAITDWVPAQASLDNLDVKSAILKAFTAFGRITRVANRYEHGISTDSAENHSIAIDIRSTHWALLRAIQLCGADASDLYERRKGEVRSFRGKDKYVPGLRPDPSFGESLDRFRSLANVTMCPFAKSAKVWAIGPWRRALSASEFVEANRVTVKRFVRVCQAEGFDGLALEATGIECLDHLKARTNELLKALGEFSDRNPLHNPIERKEWKFSIDGVDIFVTIFSSIYEEEHPRYSHSKGSSFFFLQPQISFKAKAAKEKERIRELFAQNGQDYRAVIKKVKFEAQKYIKPEDLREGAPVTWWDKASD
jgi:hypothetical protein